MAVINVMRKEHFLNIIKMVPPKAYMAITDEATYVWLAPRVTSRHRHYFKYDFYDIEEWEEIKKALVNAGIAIVCGSLSFPPT